MHEFVQQDANEKTAGRPARGDIRGHVHDVQYMVYNRHSVKSDDDESEKSDEAESDVAESDEAERSEEDIIPTVPDDPFKIVPKAKTQLTRIDPDSIASDWGAYPVSTVGAGRNKWRNEISRLRNCDYPAIYSNCEYPTPSICDYPAIYSNVLTAQEWLGAKFGKTCPA